MICISRFGDLFSFKAHVNQDWIGLKTLDEQGRIVEISTIGEHLEFTEEWFIENIIPYLDNYL